MKQIIGRFHGDKSGATVVEYGVIVGLIAVTIIVGLTLVGTSINTLFTDLGPCMTTPGTDNSVC